MMRSKFNKVQCDILFARKENENNITYRRAQHIYVKSFTSVDERIPFHISPFQFNALIYSHILI